MSNALGAQLGKGLVAGSVGAAAMTASAELEMRITGRPPSTVPAKTIAKLLRINSLEERTERYLTTLGQLGTATALGAVPGLLHAAGLGVARARAVFALAALSPDLIITPVIGSAKPPWRWSLGDFAVSALHHAVYVAVVEAAYAAIDYRLFREAGPN